MITLLKKSILRLSIFFVVGFIFFASPNSASALTCTSLTTDANWNTIGTWDCGRVPTTDDDVIISDNAGVIITLDTTGVAKSLLVINTDTTGAGNTTELRMGANTLTVSGLTTITGGSGNANKASLISLSTGTLKAQGGITFSGSTGNETLTATGAANIELTGNWTGVSDGSLNSASIVKGVGTSAINGAITIGGNLQTISGTMTIGANVAVSGTLTVDSGSILTTSSSFTFGVTGASSISGTLNNDGTGAKTYTGNFTINSGGSFTNASDSSITFSGAVFTNNSSGTVDFGTSAGTVIFNNTGGSWDGANDVTFDGNVSIVIGNGTFTNNNDATVTVMGNLLGDSGTSKWDSNSGSYLKLYGAFWTSNQASAFATASTVEYAGTGQTIKTGAAYGTLKISGTITGAATTVTVKAGFEVTGTYTASSGTITLSGSGTVFNNSGTFTGSDSNTVAVTNAGTVTLATSNDNVTFHNLTLSGGGTVQFSATRTYASTGLLTISNSTNINSTTGSSQWFIDHSGTESVNAGTISYSGCSTSDDITITAGTDGTNNDACWSFPAAAVVDTTLRRSLRLFEGFTIKFISGRIILHQSQ